MASWLGLTPPHRCVESAQKMCLRRLLSARSWAEGAGTQRPWGLCPWLLLIFNQNKVQVPRVGGRDPGPSSYLWSHCDLQSGGWLPCSARIWDAQTRRGSSCPPCFVLEASSHPARDPSALCILSPSFLMQLRAAPSVTFCTHTLPSSLCILGFLHVMDCVYA